MLDDILRGWTRYRDLGLWEVLNKDDNIDLAIVAAPHLGAAVEAGTL